MKNVIKIGALFSIFLMSLASPAEKIRPIKVTVQFLAESTAVRSSWAMNQYVYLVEVVSHRDYSNSGAMLARLIDEFPPYDTSGSSSAMKIVSTGAAMRIVRDASCDVAYAKMPLRTAPGDPLAILPERLGYHPDLPRAVGEDEVVPCYRIVRR